MRPMAACLMILSASAVSAGSLSIGGGTYRCTDDATVEEFTVVFTGATCTIDGVSGETTGRGMCSTGGRDPEIFTVSHRNTFSLINTRTNGVLDGRCY